MILIPLTLLLNHNIDIKPEKYVIINVHYLHTQKRVYHRVTIPLKVSHLLLKLHTLIITGLYH